MKRPLARATLVAIAAGALFAVGGAAAALALPVPVGNASNFAVLAGSTVTNTNTSTVTGDIGLHPGTSLTGYGPGADSIVQTGVVNLTSSVALGAKNSLTTAYNNAAAQATEFVIGTDLASQNLVPGVYSSNAQTFTNSGSLTLDAGGDASAIFIFTMDSTLITSSGSTVTLLNGASACNVFWRVGESATLGSGSQLVGTVMADQSITMDSAATISGRLWARIGAVTLDNNVITNPCFDASLSRADSSASRRQITEAPSGSAATGDGIPLTESSTTPSLVGAGIVLSALAVGIVIVARRRTS